MKRAKKAAGAHDLLKIGQAPFIVWVAILHHHQVHVLYRACVLTDEENVTAQHHTDNDGGAE